MSIALGLSLAFLLLCVVTLGIVASRVWRGDTKAAQTLELGFSIVPCGSDVKRGMVRGVVPLVLSLVFTMVSVVSFVIATTTWSGGSKFTPWSFTAACSLGAMLVAYALHLCVIIFNKPRLLVPPPLRDDPGVIAGRRPVPDDAAEAFAAEADQRARKASKRRR